MSQKRQNDDLGTAHDSLFKEKVALLRLYYPQFLEIALTDLLLSCGSDLDAVKGLLSGEVPKKRAALTQGSLGAAKARKLQVPSSVSSKTPLKNGRQKITLNTPQDVEHHLAPYASLHLNFLPKEVSEPLLAELMEQRHAYKYNQFYLFGNRCELSHLLGMYSRPEAEYAQMVYNGLKRSKPALYSENMEKACVCMEELLNKKIIPNEPQPQWNVDKRNDCNKESSEKSIENFKWTSDFCLVNCYEKLHSNLAWHSDRLSHIGPLNYVALLSLGTTRVFRLRNTYNKNAPTYHIPLPHNSILLMKPGCQEEFQHCVGPMSKAIALHETAGSLRFGITARHYPPFFIQNLPKCRCDLSMILRRSYKNVAIRGQYFWACENIYQNKDCGAFHWADFDNVSGHYIAKDTSAILTWIAPEDTEKHEYERKKKETDLKGPDGRPEGDGDDA